VIKDRSFAFGLTLVSLVPRLYVALAWAREPVWDGHYYHFGATRIAAGLGYSEDILINGQTKWNPWCHYPVGYSGFLGAAYKVLGTGLWVAPLLNALVGAATVWLVHQFACLYLSRNRARVAGALCAIHPGLILYSAVVMSEPLAAATMLAAGYVAARHGARWIGALLAGAILGASVLVRPTGLLVAPLLVLAFGGNARNALGKTAVAILSTFLVIAPWTYRNCKVMDGCALVSTNGGWNLAIGAISETGRFETLKASDGCPVVTGQVQQDRCWAQVGVQRILSAPVHWLSLVPKKLRHTYNHESFATGYLAEANPAAWPESRRAFWREKMTLFHHVLMFATCLAVFRIVAVRRFADRAFWVQFAGIVGVAAFARWALLQPEPPLYWLISVVPFFALLPLPGSKSLGSIERFLFTLVIMTTLTHAVFFGDDRYHLTVTPVLCILAAGVLRFGADERSAHESDGNSFTRGASW
jgi:hypothetical protein